MLKKICQNSAFQYLALALTAAVSLFAALALSPYSTLYSENTKHLLKAYEMLDKLNFGLPWTEILNTVTYPPCFYLNTLVYFKLFQAHNEFTADFSVLTFIIITVWSVFALLRERSSLLAWTASLICLNLFAASLVREGYLIEYALTAWTAAAPALILACPKISLWLKIPLLAFCISMGMLCKWNFFTYLIPAAACALINGLYAFFRKKSKLSGKDYLKGLLIGLYILLAGAAALWIVSLWYGAGHTFDTTNWQETFGHYQTSHSYEINIHNSDSIHQTGFRAGLSGLLRFAPVSFALYALIKVCPPYLSLLMLIGAAAALCGLFKRFAGLMKKKEASEQSLFTPPDIALLTALFVIFIYSFYPSEELFIPEQSIRHIAPLAPPAVFLAFYWPAGLKIPVKITAAALAAVFALSFGSYAGLAEDISSASQLGCKNIRTLNGLVSEIIRNTEICRMPPIPRQERFNTQIVPAANKTQIIFNTASQEAFDPFLAELYGQRGEILIVKAKSDPLTRRCSFIWTDALMQSEEKPLESPAQIKNFIAVQRILQVKRNEIVRNSCGIARYLPQTAELRCRFSALVLRAGTAEIYRIDYYGSAER